MSENEVTEHLRICANLRGPVSYERLVLDQGHTFTTLAPWDHGFDGPQGECFRNCLEIALEHPELTYCEGWATSVIPLHHAWVIDGEDRVIDPTWGHRPGTIYHGIVVPRHALLAETERQKDEDAYGWSYLYPSTRTHPLLERMEHDASHGTKR